MISKEEIEGDLVPTDLMIPVGWVVLDKVSKIAHRRTVGTGWQSRKKSTLYVTKGAAKAQCDATTQIVAEVYAIDEDNY